jgi:hypothetical protein
MGDGVPRLAVPLRLAADGRLATVDQHSDPDIQGRVEVVLRYRHGDLEADPTFGIPDLLFRQGGADTEALAREIARLVPDAEVGLAKDDGAVRDRIEQVSVTFPTAGIDQDA